MEKIRVSTKDPEQLIKDIYEKIDAYIIRTWAYDEDDNIIWHIGAQYVDAFYFELEIDDVKGLLIFNLEVTGSEWAANRSFQLLENMLNGHFKSQVAIVK